MEASSVPSAQAPTAQAFGVETPSAPTAETSSALTAQAPTVETSSAQPAQTPTVETPKLFPILQLAPTDDVKKQLETVVAHVNEFDGIVIKNDFIVRESFTNLATSFETYKTTVQKVGDKLQADIATTTTEIKTVDEKLQANVAELHAQIQTVKQELDDHTKTIDIFHDMFDEIERTNTKMSKRISLLESIMVGFSMGVVTLLCVLARK